MSLGLKKRYLMSLVQSGGGVSPRLPSAYQEVEWIMSGETTRIDTGIYGNSNIDFEIKMNIDTYISTHNSNFICLIGARETYVSNAYGMLVTNGGYLAINYNGTDTGFLTSLPVVSGTKIYSKRSNIWKIDDTILLTGSTATMTQTYTLNIFGWRDRGSYTNMGSGQKLYYCKIWKSGTLERDFVPCYRKADNEIGLYDLVNDQFYTNQGSGTFICGVPIIYDSRYQQVEYIEGSGTQYINTGLQFTTEYAHVKAKFRAINWNESGFIMGIGSQSNSNGFTINQQYWAIGNKQNTYTSNNATQMLGNDYEVEMIANNGSYQVKATGNNATASASGSYGGAILKNTDFPLFKGTIYSSCSCSRFYYFKAYDNSNNLIRDMIPVYRRSDNEIGLLDIVNDVFYTNDGSGVFTKGGNL